MKLLIVLYHRFELWNAPAWLPERLRHDFPGIEVTFRDTYKDIEQYITDAEIVIAWSLRPEQIEGAGHLRWIHSPAAAVHQLMFPELVDSDIVVTNASSVHGAVVAEHVLALILAMAKRLPSAFRYQQRHVWAQELLWKESPQPREIAGATLGLVGLGSIGYETAIRAASLGMRIVAIREHPERGLGPLPFGALHHAVYGPDAMNRMVRQSDYVILAAPVTPATKALMDAERLALMQPHACLINVSRGPLVDEPALVDALRKKSIAGAALDVFIDEPLPETSPLWDMDNVIITPHSAALTSKLWDRHYALIKENVRRYLAKEPLLHVVDKRKGY